MKTKRSLTIAGIVIGGLLTLSPLFGMLGTALSMNYAFSKLGNSGISNPGALSDSIGTALLSSALGVLLFPVGVIILALSLVLYFRCKAATPPPLPEHGR